MDKNLFQISAVKNGTKVKIQIHLAADSTENGYQRLIALRE